MSITYEVTVKSVPPITAATLQEKIPNWNEVEPTFNRIFDELFGYVMGQGATITGPAFDMWLEEPTGTDMPVVACAPVAAAISETDRVKMQVFPAVETMASTTHHGAFKDGLSNAHHALMEWVGSNGYRITGPGREIYHVYEQNGDPSKWVTEIQYPIEKV